MTKETFRTIIYNDEKNFKHTKDGKIELKEYSDDLVFAVNFDSTFDANFCLGSKEPKEIIGTPNIVNFDAFGFSQHGELSGSIIYEEESFRNIENNMAIKFWLYSEFINAYGEQSFKNSEMSQITEVGTYGFSVLQGETLEEISFPLTVSSTKIDVFNLITTEIANKHMVLWNPTETFKLTSSILGNKIEILPPMADDVIDITTFFGGLQEGFVNNAPTTDISFLKLKNNIDDRNSITITHNTDGAIILQMFDTFGNLSINENLGIWSNEPTNYTAFELNINDQVGQFYLDGKLRKVFMTGFNRENPKTDLILSGGDTEFHHIDGLAIYDEIQHTKNYEVETFPLLPFNTEKPFIDIMFGTGFRETEVRDLIIDGSADGLEFTVKIGLTWYYYYSGSWRPSDGSFSQTSTAETFEANFSNLFFNEDSDLIIRVYFSTDGFTPVELDEISIITEKGTVAAAYITGDIRIIDPVDLSLNNKIKITTDQTSQEVDISTAALLSNAVSLEEIKQAIRDANILGLESVGDDGNGRLVLQAATIGSSSYLSVTESSIDNCLDLVWGDDTQDTGEDDETTTGVFQNYNEIFRWVRSKLGAPLVPVELTDEHLEDCLSSAVYHYNKWRNFEEEILYLNLHGSPKNGWELPPIVGGVENITDVILENSYPMGVFGNGNEDLMSNIYMQHMMRNNNGTEGVADYNISLMGMEDMQDILGTTPRWELLNRRLFIFPLPHSTMKIAIKFKSALSLDGIVTSQSIKDLTLAEAKIQLGGIRSTFGNQVPGGNGMLSLNGSELKSEGNQEKINIIDGFRKQSEPLGFFFT